MWSTLNFIPDMRNILHIPEWEEYESYMILMTNIPVDTDTEIRYSYIDIDVYIYSYSYVDGYSDGDGYGDGYSDGYVRVEIFFNAI